jgi:hypothetical protein
MDNCPHCGASLIGDEIPEEMREHYSPPYHWRREIGVEHSEIYDGIYYWMCPDCKGEWGGYRALGKGNEV